jgi:hypothetical protein
MVLDEEASVDFVRLLDLYMSNVILSQHLM